MIFDSIKNFDNYKSYPILYKALEFLSKKKNWTDVKKREDIIKDFMFANKIEFISKPKEECKYEAHKRFIDIHYIFEGEEVIDTADVKNLCEIEEFSKDNDIGFYSGERSGGYILREGDFMVCYPSDAYKVGMMNEKPQKIKKIVIKLDISLIN